VSTLAQIEESIAKLPPAEFRELLQRLNERAAREWDQQFEDDVKAGRLDFLVQEIEDDIASGRTRPLDEICRDE